MPPGERFELLSSTLDSNPRFIWLPRAAVRFLDIGPTQNKNRNSETPWMFVHGFGGSAGDFAPLIIPLSKEFRVAAIDLPGFGGSFALEEEYSVSAGAEAISDFAAAAKIEKADLVCHSLGGQICLSLALSHAPFIRSLVLINAAGVYSPSEFVRGISKRIGKINTGDIVTTRGRSIPDLISDDRTVLKRLVARDSSFFAALESFKENYRGRIRQIEVPTVVIWGRNDPVFPVENAFLLKENVDQAVLYVVEGAGHSPQMSHPDLVMNWLMEHRRRLDGAEKNKEL